MLCPAPPCPAPRHLSPLLKSERRARGAGPPATGAAPGSWATAQTVLPVRQVLEAEGARVAPGSPPARLNRGEGCQDRNQPAGWPGCQAVHRSQLPKPVRCRWSPLLALLGERRDWDRPRDGRLAFQAQELFGMLQSGLCGGHFDGAELPRPAIARGDRAPKLGLQMQESKLPL